MELIGHIAASEPYIAWFTAAILLSILEVAIPAHIFLGFALGAAGVGLCHLLGLAPPGGGIALVAFACLSLAGWLLIRGIVGVRPNQVKIVDKDINEKMFQVVYLDEPISGFVAGWSLDLATELGAVPEYAMGGYTPPYQSGVHVFSAGGTKQRMVTTTCCPGVSEEWEAGRKVSVPKEAPWICLVAR